MPGIKTTQINNCHIPTLVNIPNTDIHFDLPNSYIEESHTIKQDTKFKELEMVNWNIKKKTQRAYNNILEFKWDNITINTKPQTKYWKRSNTTTKNLLSNISGSVRTGEALAIIGGSGAGKTTLLNFLSKKIDMKNLTVSGIVHLNNIPFLETYNQNYINGNIYYKGEDLEAISSYVMQDDILEAFMTPTEILLFTAKLKLNLKDEEIEQRVEKLIQELNLNNCRNTKIGNNLIRGVSGGERKRTSIAIELISDPKIVFLDEPTTGLDSFNAYELVRNLCKLAINKEKIIIFTIHQPSSEIFTELQKIFILSDGKPVYFGDIQSSINFFSNDLKLAFPDNYNPFEFFIEMTNFEILKNKHVNSIKAYGSIFGHIEKKNDQEKQQAFSNYIQLISDIFNSKKKLIEAQEFKNQPYIDYIAIDTEEENLNINNHHKQTEFREEKYNMMTENFATKEIIDYYMADKCKTRGFFYEFSLLFGRNSILAYRNAKLLMLRIIQNIITAILLAILFKNITNNNSGIQNRQGLIFITLHSTVFGATTTTILVFSEEKKVFLRERSNKMYSIASYFLAKTLYELPLFFISVNCSIAIIYMSVQLNDTFSYKFYVYTGLLHLLSISGTSYAFFLGSLVSNQEALTSLNTAFTVPLMLLSGFFANASNYAPYLKPFEYISIFKYGFQLLIETEYTDLQPLNCANNMNNPCDPLKSLYDFKQPFWISCMGVGLLIIFFKFLAFFIVSLKSRMKS